jgi:predicted ATPase
MTRVRSLRLDGFKSIRHVELKLEPLNVLIGTNGAGKSNLLSFFRLLNYAMTEGLGAYVGLQGGANRLLHFGAKVTPQLSAELDLTSDEGINRYHIRLAHAAGDVLVFLEESVEFVRNDLSSPRRSSLGPGHFESLLGRAASDGDKRAQFVKWQLDRWKHFHFHDTSSTAAIRQPCELRQNRYLRSDGGNLAAYLYALRQTNPQEFGLIRDTVRRVAPFFDDFVLRPDRLNLNTIRLEWTERGASETFDAFYLSDGTLRFIALATLLLQPELPLLIVIDEPELGLHPFAITLLASMMKAAATRAQLVVSTQSVALVDELDPKEVVVVERREGASEFGRLDPAELEGWLADYGLGEIWQKNLIGGRPTIEARLDPR